jgi:hypothetical protein
LLWHWNNTDLYDTKLQDFGKEEVVHKYTNRKFNTHMGNLLGS